MEANGLVEIMAMAEGVLFRYGKTGKRYEPPCWATGGCLVGERPMWFQLCVMGESAGPCSAGVAEAEPACVDVYLNMRGGMEDAPSWKLRVDGSGKWDKAVYGGRTLSSDEWELDDIIGSAVLRRNAALE